MVDRDDIQVSNERLLRLLSDVVQSNLHTEDRINHRLTTLVNQSARHSPQGEGSNGDTSGDKDTSGDRRWSGDRLGSGDRRASGDRGESGDNGAGDEAAGGGRSMLCCPPSVV